MLVKAPTNSYPEKNRARILARDGSAITSRHPQPNRTSASATLLDSASAELAGSSSTPHLDAELLLAHVLGFPRSRLLAHPEFETPQDKRRLFEQMINLRRAGQPLAYLTGQREFWSLTLNVTPATLIPRPETELLVEHALRLVPDTEKVAILELGTGSGAIALALASERPHASITATDISNDALAIAKKNAAVLDMHNVKFIQGDWFTPVSGRRFRVIVSNPPYVAEGDPHLQSDSLRFEPREALVGGADGLAAIRKIVESASSHLEQQGTLLLEHGLGQAEAVRKLMTAAGFTNVYSASDLAGIERVCVGTFAGRDGTGPTGA